MNAHLSSIRRSAAPGAARPRAPGRTSTVRVAALFGWGKKDAEKEAELEEAFRAQQEKLERRRTGEAIQEAKERRRKVRETVAERQAVRDKEKELLSQGIMPETLAEWKPYKNEDDAKGTSGIVVPVLPFGLRKYDEGERFDLRSPYADGGYVDPDEETAWDSVKNIGKKLLNFSGKEPESQVGKPIIWAKDYDKYKREQALKKAAGVAEEQQ